MGTAKGWLSASTVALLVLLLPLPAAGAADDVANQEVVPTVTITADSTSHNEPDGPMSFTLHASPAPATDLEVSLDSRLTGVIFTDAVERSFTTTIPGGETTHTFDFPIVNDFTVEPDGAATITVADSEASYEVGTPAQAETELVDDDAPITVSWDASTIHVNEDAGTFNVPIFLRVRDGERPGTFATSIGVFEGLTFLVTTQPVTADPIADFVSQSLNLTYEVGSFTIDASGDYTLTDEIEFQILDDTDDEPGETFQVVIESAVAVPLQNDGTVLPSEPKTIVIADDDGENNEPEFGTAPDELSIREDAEVGTLIGVPFEVTDVDGHLVTLAFSGAESEFALDESTNRIRTTEQLDFETQPSYDLEFTAADGTGDVTIHTVSVEVINVDEPGLVELVPMSPEEGAMVAASLVDDDGPSADMTWEWSESTTMNGAFSPIDGATEDNYMPTADDVGMYLRATVIYTDGEGDGKSAESSTSEPVTARQESDPPTITVLWSENPFTVREDDGTVVLPITVRVDGMQPPGTYEVAGVTYEGRAFSISTRSETATSPHDFEVLSVHQRLPAGSFSLQASGYYEANPMVSLTINDDDAIEPTESLRILAEMAPGSTEVTLPDQDLQINIEDNDEPDPVRPPWPPPDFCSTHPDTAADTSTPLGVDVGGNVEGDFCSKDDADWVAVDLVAGQAYQVEGTFTDPDRVTSIYIGGMRASDGSLISGSHSFDGNPDGTSNTSGYIIFRPTTTGIHYIVAGDPDWWNFTDATAPLPWRLEVHEVDWPADDVVGIHPLGLELNNYGQLVASFDGSVNTHGDRDTFAIDVEVGHAYYVEMRTRNGSGIFNCIHSVSPEATPRVPISRGWFDCQHKPGWKAYLWFTARAEGRYLITVGSENGTGDYELRVRDTNAVPPGVWDTPLPDDDIAQDTSTTGLVHINDSWVTFTAVQGEIDLAGDKDWFRVELEGDRRYQIDIRGEDSGVGTLRNSYMWIHDAGGQRIIYGGGTHLEASLVWTPPTSGTYFIEVAGSRYDIGTYDLSVIDPEDPYNINRPS